MGGKRKAVPKSKGKKDAIKPMTSRPTARPVVLDPCTCPKCRQSKQVANLSAGLGKRKATTSQVNLAKKRRRGEAKDRDDDNTDGEASDDIAGESMVEDDESSEESGSEHMDRDESSSDDCSSQNEDDTEKDNLYFCLDILMQQQSKILEYVEELRFGDGQFSRDLEDIVIPHAKDNPTKLEKMLQENVLVEDLGEDNVTPDQKTLAYSDRDHNSKGVWDESGDSAFDSQNGNNADRRTQLEKFDILGRDDARSEREEESSANMDVGTNEEAATSHSKSNLLKGNMEPASLGSKKCKSLTSLGDAASPLTAFQPPR